MEKLVAAFLASTSDNRKPSAAKLIAYLRKHPMAECMANAAEHNAIMCARVIVEFS
jgi:hypothetical protein